MNTYEVKGHASSILPEGRNFKMIWNDEFDGIELDTSKWDFRLSMMGKPHDAWTDRGVRLDGRGNLVFTLMEENGRPVSSQLQTGYNFMDEPVRATTFGEDHLQWNIGKLKENRFVHTYGYYECRCKLQKRADAWWTAFWIQSPIIGASLDAAESGTELDVMECFEEGVVAPHNAFTGGYGQDCKRAKVGGVAGLDVNEYHRFGLLWDESGYTFFVDGKEDGHISEYVSKRPEFILISTEVKGYRFADHKPVKEAFDAVGDTFTVDYIRVFDCIE